MRRRVFIALFLGVGIAIGAIVYWRTRVPDSLAFLEAAPSWTIYSLDPGREIGPDFSISPAFHGWKILGQTQVNATKTPALLAALRKGIQESDGRVAACFNPRLGIQATRNGHTMDFVVCFQCLSMEVFYDSQRNNGYTITESPAKIFDDVLRDAAIPLAPKE